MFDFIPIIVDRYHHSNYIAYMCADVVNLNLDLNLKTDVRIDALYSLQETTQLVLDQCPSSKYRNNSIG